MTPVYYSHQLNDFDFGPGHPFDGARFGKFIGMLEKADIFNDFEIVEPVPATDGELRLVHEDSYLKKIEELRKTGGWLTMDTPVTPGANDAQRAIAGSGLQACRWLLKNRGIAHTFGGFHHAGRNYGEGFCYYNDVAIAARALTDIHGLERVMIVDTDAHQGNGTMDIFYDDPKVLFVSIHQDPHTLYPGRGFTWETGQGEGKGYTVNIPMPPFSSWGQYKIALDDVLEPIASEFKPQFIIRNGGSDPLYVDRLTMLGLDYEGLYRLSNYIRKISDNSSGKLLDMMVSGYGDQVIYGWMALFCGTNGLDKDRLFGFGDEPPRSPPSSGESLDRATESMIKALKRELEEHWSCF